MADLLRSKEKPFKKRQLTILTFLGLCLFLSANSQAIAQKTPFPDPFNVPHLVVLKLTSNLLSREVLYRVVLPAGYGKEKDTRYATVYLLHGLSGHADNWTNKTLLLGHAAAYKSIIITPEGGDGWYTDSATIPNDRYESYIVKDLIPEIDKKFRTIPDREHRAIAGLSMGGYGAIKFGLKYPHIFSIVGSFSGALGAATVSEKEFGSSNPITKTIYSVFGNENSQTRRENDVFGLVESLSSEKIKALPFIYLDCGTEDFLFQNNREFDALLVERKIPHEFRELPGNHNWQYWDQQVEEFLQVAKRQGFGK